MCNCTYNKVEPCCEIGGRCSAFPASVISMCAHCGAEMWEVDGKWYHHSQMDLPKEERKDIHDVWDEKNTIAFLTVDDEEIIKGLEHESLIIFNRNSEILKVILPSSRGWSHYELCEAGREYRFLFKGEVKAYLGNKYIGGTTIDRI